MSIRGIKNKADGIYMKYRKQIIPEFFYVGYVGLLAQYLRSGLFSFFVSLFLCPIAHGYVKCAMKLVDDEHPLIDYHQSMIGIIEFPRVAPAYLMRKAIILFITLLCALPILLSVHSLIPEFSLEWISSLGNTLIQTEFFVPNFEEIHVLMSNSLLILNIIVCIFVYLFLTALFTPVPYVMELEEFSWSECISYSIRLMRGHMIDFLMLYVSYFIRHVIYWMITGLCMLAIGSLNEILTLFCMVTSLFLYIEIFKGRFEIAKYLFYQEIRGDHDERNRGN
jgi:hypothetical protein